MMSDPFPAAEFDHWAENYDQSVTDDQHFPFMGYEAVLDKIIELAAPSPGQHILDLGTGTGNLALRFNAAGCQIWGTDFSPAMLAKAQEKLPDAHLFQADLRGPWPQGLNRRFDCIVSAYVFHHFEKAEKVQISAALVRKYLAPNSRLILADIAFPNQNALEKVKSAAGEAWEDEFYWSADECLPALEAVGLKARFHQVSACAGIFEIKADR
jgi:putative AdoMet-dependent methyltransferase